MKTSQKALAIVAVPAVAASGVALAAQAAAGWPNGGNGDYHAAGINIRSTPSTSGTIVGSGYHGQGVHYGCWKIGGGYDGPNGSGSTAWLYHTNLATGVSGWSGELWIDLSGTPLYCGTK